MLSAVDGAPGEPWPPRCHLSVRRRRRRPHSREGLRAFEGVLCLNTRPWLNKRSSPPAFNLFTRAPDMLQSAPVRVGNLPLCIWHGKNSPKIKGINTTIVFLRRHNIYALPQVAYCCERGISACLLPDMKQEPSDQCQCHTQFSYLLAECWESVQRSV